MLSPRDLSVTSKEGFDASWASRGIRIGFPEANEVNTASRYTKRTASAMLRKVGSRHSLNLHKERKDEASEGESGVHHDDRLLTAIYKA